MADTAQAIEILTADEYLVREEVSSVRHEFVNGVLYAMGGSTDRHNRIVGNLTAALLAHLPERCVAYNSDMRVRIKQELAEFYYYPDCMVCCGPADQSKVWRDNPMVLGEVLSRSTERVDRTEKFDAYRQIPTLQEYLLIEQSLVRVELFRRENGWQREVLGAGDRLRLASIEFETGVDALYRRVEF